MRGEDFQSLLIPQEYSYSSEKSDNDMHLKTFASNVFLKYWMQLTDESNVLNQFLLENQRNYL